MRALAVFLVAAGCAHGPRPLRLDELERAFAASTAPRKLVALLSPS